MLLSVGKSVAIPALLIALRGWPSRSWGLELSIAICLGAVFGVVQAYRMNKFRWGIAFVVIAALFNPFSPMTVSRINFLIIDCASIVVFVLSFAGLRKHALPEAQLY